MFIHVSKTKLSLSHFKSLYFILRDSTKDKNSKINVLDALLNIYV